MSEKPTGRRQFEMNATIAAAIAATMLAPFAAGAKEYAHDGILWHYDVTDAGAVVLAVEPLPTEENGGDVADEGTKLAQPSALETLKIPSDFDETATVAIADDAFSGLNYLREVKIPSGVASVGARAFKDCRGLKSVKIPASVIEIGSEAFSGCRSLKAVALGESVTNLPEKVFFDCRALATIDLPGDLASVGERAFADCSALHVVTMPQNVTNIAAAAFADCSSLATVIFLGAEPQVGEDAFAGVDPKCFFRASADKGWGVEIPGVWQGRGIVDLAIETYRRTFFIFLPTIVGVIGTISILVLAIVLRERRDDDEDGADEE